MTDAQKYRLQLCLSHHQVIRRAFIMKLTGIYKFYLSLLLCSVALPSVALPKYERTILPFPDYMDEADKAMAREVIMLQVYQDDKDRNQYYYIPPFHIRQYTRGAGGMLLHSHNIKQYAAANKEIEARLQHIEGFHQSKLAELAEQIKINRERVEVALTKLEEALDRGNARIIELREKSLEREQNALDKSTQELNDANEIIGHGGTLLPLALRKSYNEQVIMKLAQAGVDVPYTGQEDPDAMFVTLKNVIQDFSSSYGGYISVNAYGGFTQAQVDALAEYRLKYMPHIKVSLLPVEKLTFFSLTEWQNDLEAWSYSSKIFRNIKGSGDYLGAAIVLDTSIAGALGLAEHLQPFVLPVGIRATFKQMAEPTEAELRCDFSTGYEVNGRADVRDGLIIYDNDITNTISTSDHSYGACNLKYISGDQNSAQFKALQAMEQEFESMRIHRTYLANAEKNAYYQSVLDDIANNRREDEPTYTRTLRRLDERGWVEVAVEGVTRAADFHWHTNIQDMSNISNVKFTKRISVRGHEVVEREMPTNLCLVYNSEIDAYDRCTTLEEQHALNMQKATQVAGNSPACAGTVNPFECGTQRDAAGSIERVGDRIPTDDSLITEFR
jgi:hypothetical protein